MRNEQHTATTMEASSSTVWSVQYLRAIAAIDVVFGHAWAQLPWFMLRFPHDIGIVGVDLFFVISGFVIVYVTAGRERTWQSFLWARAIRIVPIYWIYTIGTAVLVLVVPQLFSKEGGLDFYHLILSLLFVPHVSPTDAPLMLPLLKLGWTLNYEMYFYLVFAVGMLVGSRFWAPLGVLIAVVMASHGTPLGNTELLRFYSNTIVLEFAFGMIAAALFLRGFVHRLGAWIGSLMVVVGLMLIYFGSDYVATIPRALIFGIPSFILVMGMLAIEARGKLPRIGFLRVLGDASYSVYLAHLFPIAVLRYCWATYGFQMDGWSATAIFVVACLAAGALVGLASYFLVERPLLLFFKRKRSSEA